MGHALKQAEVTLGLPITPMTVIGAVAPPLPARSRTRPRRQRRRPTPAKKTSRKVPVLIEDALVMIAAVVGGVVLLTGGDDDDDDEAPTGGFERPEQVDVDLTPISDDTDTITAGDHRPRGTTSTGRNPEVA